MSTQSSVKTRPLRKSTLLYLPFHVQYTAADAAHPVASFSRTRAGYKCPVVCKGSSVMDTPKSLRPSLPCSVWPRLVFVALMIGVFQELTDMTLNEHRNVHHSN